MSESSDKILRAMASSPQRWQTARGIAEETGLPLAEVYRVLKRSPGVVRARKGSRHGEALWARREKRAVDVTDTSAEEQGVTEVEHQTMRFTYLVLLPFDSSSTRLRDSIRTIVREEQGDPLFLNTIRSGAVWVDEISRVIRTSHAVIADISRLNPNVMFELGMAHGLGKPLILLLSEAENTSLPTDLIGSQYVTYSPDNLSPFVDRLRRMVRQLALHRGAL